LSKVPASRPRPSARQSQFQAVVRPITSRGPDTKFYPAEAQPQAESAFRRVKRPGSELMRRVPPEGDGAVLSVIALSARRVLEPSRQQIAQQSGAGAKDRKGENRNADFQRDGERPLGGVKRTE
jgi:hypothetical protein